jgi:hypothetical protein
MPLDPTKLTGSPGLPGAGNRDYPATGDDCADEWADALQAYATGIIPASTTVSAATATLRTSLKSAFALPTASRMAAFNTAMAAWATTIGGGQAGFVATPPVGLPLATLLALPTPPSSRSAGVSAAASSIDAWMKTGIAVMTAPPGTTLNWS